MQTERINDPGLPQGLFAVQHIQAGLARRVLASWGDSVRGHAPVFHVPAGRMERIC
jgi:hypothetical protein